MRSSFFTTKEGLEEKFLGEKGFFFIFFNINL